MTRPALAHREGPSGASFFANGLGQLNGAPTPNLRERLEAEIERLIAMLDAIDGDPDLEPSIIGSLDPRKGYAPIEDDREGGDVLDEGEPDDWSDEPSLGWGHPGQGGIPRGWHY